VRQTEVLRLNPRTVREYVQRGEIAFDNIVLNPARGKRQGESPTCIRLRGELAATAPRTTETSYFSLSYGFHLGCKPKFDLLVVDVNEYLLAGLHAADKSQDAASSFH
jgi:hypothetical protein